eukprot:TRINITY_DN1823_c1_g1_i1.p3 TRINITY_DN1823_c1_g1~~TRINITY_DN1823_c1_g1_i1.p3  ORF type:complete len:205 (+),score=31.51 TRINITY_DN1823_c1_g1_i1:269-883(+)
MHAAEMTKYEQQGALLRAEQYFAPDARPSFRAPAGGEELAALTEGTEDDDGEAERAKAGREAGAVIADAVVVAAGACLAHKAAGHTQPMPADATGRTSARPQLLAAAPARAAAGHRAGEGVGTDEAGERRDGLIPPPPRSASYPCNMETRVYMKGPCHTPTAPAPPPPLTRGTEPSLSYPLLLQRTAFVPPPTSGMEPGAVQGG